MRIMEWSIAASERNALRARVAELEAELSAIRARMLEYIDEPPADDATTVDLAAEVVREAMATRAHLVELEAPPVVPAGWTLEKRNDLAGIDTWGATDASNDNCVYQLPCGDIARSRGLIPIAVLRAITWAIERNECPPHAGNTHGRSLDPKESSDG